jgi:hypothetical protein
MIVRALPSLSATLVCFEKRTWSSLLFTVALASLAFTCSLFVLSFRTVTLRRTLTTASFTFTFTLAFSVTFFTFTLFTFFFCGIS